MLLSEIKHRRYVLIGDALHGEVEQHLKQTGETFNDFVLRAIRQTMEQDRTPF